MQQVKDPALSWHQLRSMLWHRFNFRPRNFHMQWVRPKKKKFSPKFSLSFIPVLISKQDKNNQIPPGKSLIPRCLIGYWVYTKNHQVGVVTSLFCLPLLLFSRISHFLEHFFRRTGSLKTQVGTEHSALISFGFFVLSVNIK